MICEIESSAVGWSKARWAGVVALDKGDVGLVVLIHRHRRHDVGKQGAGAVELLAVDPRLVAGKALGQGLGHADGFGIAADEVGTG